jgi:predicted DNA-binding transcriptional regulator YafY
VDRGQVLSAIRDKLVHMLETSARLLRLLSLLQSRRDWSSADLADRLGVSARTIRRDVDRLRGLGYPVHATPGVAGGYRLGAGAALPPLLLDDDEAVAVALGLRTATNGTVAGIEETSVRALAKLEQVLPARLRHRVGALHAATVPLVGASPIVDPDVLMVVATACRDHERVRFSYAGRSPDRPEGSERSDGTREPTERRVEPHRLVHTGRRWYLVAWDLDRDDWRTFRVDRIAGLSAAGHRFAPRQPPEGDVARYTSRGLSTEVYRYQARLTLHVPAEVAAERITPTSGLVEPIDDRTCTLHIGSRSLDELAVWLAVIGFDFDVHEPPELADHVHGLAKRLARVRLVPG